MSNISEYFKAELREEITIHSPQKRTIPFYSSLLLSSHPPPPFVSHHPPFGLSPTFLTWSGRWWPKEDFPLLWVFSSHSPLTPGHTPIALGVLPRLATLFSYPALSLLPPFSPGVLLKIFFPNQCHPRPAWNPG